jgi:hypothetical protein
MNLAQKQTQINQLKQQLSLKLDNPPSVKLQIKQINLIQKQLKAIKKELNLMIKEINQQAMQSTPDSIISVGLDLFGKRKLAGSVRSHTRKAIQAEKISLRQPYLELKDQIDQIILAGDQLKLKGAEYLLEKG